MKNKTSSKKKKSILNVFSGNPFMASVFGALSGIISIAILTPVFSAIAQNLSDPDSFVLPFGMIISFVSYFLAGLLAAKLKSAALPCGILSGVILQSLMFILSILIKGNYSAISSPILETILRIAFVFISVLGAVIAVNSKKSPKKKKRK